MNHVVKGFFIGIILGLLFWGWRMAVGWRRHRKVMAELDECQRHTQLAARNMGKNDEAYEFHMKQAATWFDKSYQKRRR